jgi:hypothetical protein
LPTADSNGSDLSVNDDWASHKVKHLNGVLANGTNGTGAQRQAPVCSWQG